ncbi:coiled-coil domain-containing protein 97 [Dermacentor variabilis]|uniref:coiled-coil domain-containing protein 97 n=1 Tax=Dermacentor variabilis TaxID=34621 RepID=UPI003F5BF475
MDGDVECADDAENSATVVNGVGDPMETNAANATNDVDTTIDVDEASQAIAEPEYADVDDAAAEQRRQILDTVAASEGFFKHQQRGEPDLSYEEKREIAEKTLDSNVPLFLQRYAKFLYREDASYFEALRTVDYEVDFHVREIERRSRDRSRQLSVQTKNRRYEALERLKTGGEYFSDKEMRRRNPLLFEQMIGRYMTEKEKLDLDKMDFSTLTFSGLLMEHIDRNEVTSLRRQQQDLEEATFEESDSDTEEEECEEDMPPVSATEKRLLRNEFVNTMYESFLSGKDKDYDYESVDNNADFDSLQTRQHDEEEKYFDAEEPEVLDTVT